MLDVCLDSHFSKWAGLSALFIIMGSILITLCLPISLWESIALIVGILCYGGWILWQWASNALVKIEYAGDSWRLTTRKHVFQGVLRGDSTLTHWVSVLRFQVAGRRSPLSWVVFRDSLTPDEYRRLLVMLRNVKLHGIQPQNALTSSVL